MAEVVGLAASIIQIAGAGARLSVALYNFTNSAARADQDVKDIADDVELTSNALESVGRVFESEEAGSIVSKKAIQDANNIIRKCQSVFDEFSEMVEKRRRIGKDGKKGLSVMGKLAWPMKEQRVELNRRRLESLKNSLVLLLHVLQLAQGQARGRVEKSVLEEERDKIRELHQRQQDSLKSLQALENRFCHVALDDEETLRGSSIASRVPTLELMANAPVMELPPLEKPSKPQKDTITIDLSTANDSDTSDSDATMSGDDNEEHISTEELAKAADHVKKLLKRITMLQKNFDADKKHQKRHVHKIYQRFCRKFESGIKPCVKDANFGELRAEDSFDLNDSGGALECFDFESFLQVPGESTQFPLLDFDFPGEQHTEPQQANNPEAVPSMQSCQHPPLVSADLIEPVPSPSAQTPPYPPVPLLSAASDLPFDLSGQQQGPILDQGQSAPAQQSPEPLAQTWARMQRQAQSMAQQQAQAQQPQAQSQAAMQPMPSIDQSLPSPAMPMLNRHMLPPVSTSSLYVPTYSRPVMPETSRSSHRRVESSLRPRVPMPTAHSALLPRPPIGNTALQDYQYQLMFLDCQKRRRKSASEQKQDVDSQLRTRDDEPTTPSAFYTTHTQEDTHERGKHRISNKLSDLMSGRVGYSPDMFGKQASQEPDTSSFIDGLLDVEDVETVIYPKKRGRKPALTAEQKRNATGMRRLGACKNCQSLKLKCDPKSPCGSCVKRNAEQEEISSKICCETNIAQRLEGFQTGIGLTSPLPLPGVRSRHIKFSGFAESDARDSPREESFKPSGERRVGRQRQRSTIDSRIDQRSSRKRRRLGKDEDEHCSKDAADITLHQGENEEMMETGIAWSSVDKDIVDVLLEQWTVPVY